MKFSQAQTRQFLERVVREERMHASMRLQDAHALASMEADHEALEDKLHDVAAQLTSATFELNELLLRQALAAR
jgi:hypothetical protein